MTKLLIPGLTTVLDALNRHKKLRLNDNNLSLSLESAARVVKTERGHRYLSADHTAHIYNVTLTLHEEQMQTLIKILNAAPVNGEPTND